MAEQADDGLGTDGAPAPAGRTPQPSGFAADERLQELSQGLLSQRGVHHAIVAVESTDGSRRFVGCAGEANPDGTPVRADTPFFIASVTKLYVAATVMRLRERGEVDLDAVIAAYLPTALTAGLHRLGGVDRTDSITVRHLLGHTSGLPDYIEQRPRGGRSLIERLVSEGDMTCGIEEAVDITRRLTPHFPPQPRDARRPKARYSDTNYRLLMAIIERVTGRPLHRVFEELLFGPLGLRRTYLPGHEPPDLAVAPATLWFGDRPLEIPRALASLCDLYSTAGDSIRFLRGLMRGEIFEDPATLGAMQERWVRFGFPVDAAALRAPGWPIEYGLGMMRYRLPRALTPGRRMPAVIGHTGSTGCWLFYCPELEVLLSGTVDQATGGAVPYRLVPRILRALEASPD